VNLFPSVILHVIIDDSRCYHIAVFIPRTLAGRTHYKGKIERPYGWLQNRIVRTCAREGIDNIVDGNKILEAEAARYNFRKVHSATGEVPYYRLKRLLDEGKTLFREFVIPSPYKSTKDIFALRGSRVVNPYRKISFNKLVINITGVPIRDSVSLRIVPDLASGMAEIRF